MSEDKEIVSTTPKVVLPKLPIPASHQSPRNLVIFSKPKAGKTSAFAKLPNALILDLESGTDLLAAIKIKASSVEEIKAIGEQIKAEGYPYDYIIIDTMTRLEEICVPYAEILYSKTSMGKNWFKKDENGNYAADSGKAIYGNILNMPQGSGYAYLREGLTKVVEYIKTWAPRMIQACHLKEILLDKEGVEFNAMDLDLTGKIKRIISSQSDGIGYLYRKGNKNILSFKTSDQVSCGARPDHLRNKEIVISEMIDDKLVTYWENIYID